MATKLSILQGLTALAVDNSIDISNEKLFESKVNLTNADCAELTDEQFTKSINKIRSLGIELFGKLPKSALILENAGHKTQSPELKASLEVARILDFASYYFGNSVWFDNPTTNACVEMAGGIKKIAWDIDPTNEKKQERVWIAKDLKEKWLNCFDSKKEKHDPCVGRIQDRFMSVGEWVEPAQAITFIGDKSKYLAIETKPEPKALTTFNKI